MKWIWTGCRRRPEISLLAAGALSQEESILLERHLIACQECQVYYREIKALIQPMAGWGKNLQTMEATPAAQARWATAVRGGGASSRADRPLLKKFGRIVWSELIWPSRYAWAGLAALWVAMLVVNHRLSAHDRNGAGRDDASSGEIIQAWEERNQVLAELTQPGFAVPAPPPNVPRSRSERKQDWAVT